MRSAYLVMVEPDENHNKYDNLMRLYISMFFYIYPY